jgi:uncharacterized protein YbaP (TraB family)
MSSRNLIGIAVLIIGLYSSSATALAVSCVWKVTTGDGHTLYLGGSFHALRPSDYPLPREYNRDSPSKTTPKRLTPLSLP